MGGEGGGGRERARAGERNEQAREREVDGERRVWAGLRCRMDAWAGGWREGGREAGQRRDGSLNSGRDAFCQGRALRKGPIREGVYNYP